MPEAPEDRPGRDEAGTLWSDMARYAHLGLQIALATGLFLLVGWWVDNRVGTTPLLTILGAMLGAGAGFYSMYHHLVVEPRRDRARADEPERREEEP